MAGILQRRAGVIANLGWAGAWLLIGFFGLLIGQGLWWAAMRVVHGLEQIADHQIYGSERPAVWSSAWLQPAFVLWMSLYVMLLWVVCEQALGLRLWLTVFVMQAGVLAVVDAKTGLLPNELTLALLVSGFVAQASVGPSPGPWPPLDHLWATVLGWTAPAALSSLHRWVRGFDAIGQGDMKLLAGFGMWLGVDALVSIWLIASAVLLVYTAIMLCLRKASERFVAFGPFLVMGANAVMVWNHV
jgi:prepilin signal peptidase PulO-like enzyme (type II secretory pathway)